MRRLGWGLAAILLLFVVLTVPLVLSPFAPSPSAPAPTATAAPAPSPSAAPARTTPYRAVWVSYLEWQQVDFSSAGAFAAALTLAGLHPRRPCAPTTAAPPRRRPRAPVPRAGGG